MNCLKTLGRREVEVRFSTKPMTLRWTIPAIRQIILIMSMFRLEFKIRYTKIFWTINITLIENTLSPSMLRPWQSPI